MLRRGAECHAAAFEDRSFLSTRNLSLDGRNHKSSRGSLSCWAGARYRKKNEPDCRFQILRLGEGDPPFRGVEYGSDRSPDIVKTYRSTAIPIRGRDRQTARVPAER